MTSTTKYLYQSQLFSQSDFMAKHLNQLSISASPDVCKFLDKQKHVVTVAALYPSKVYKAASTVPTNASAARVINVSGIEFTISPKRFATFAANNSVCTSCGIRGNAVLIQHKTNCATGSTSQYADLYSISKGKVVAFTVDHILPDVWGGKYSCSNFQTMCANCNQKKGNCISLKEIDMISSDISAHVREQFPITVVELVLNVYKSINQTNDAQYKIRLHQVLTDHRKPSIDYTDEKQVSCYLRKFTNDLIKATPNFHSTSIVDRLVTLVQLLKCNIKHLFQLY